MVMSRRAQLLSISFIAALTLVLGACGDDSGPVKYHAVCSRMHGMIRGWEGPRHDKREDALHDAEEHKRYYPGHTVTIEETH